jgi:hypothetical protein
VSCRARNRYLLRSSLPSCSKRPKLDTNRGPNPGPTRRHRTLRPTPRRVDLADRQRATCRRRNGQDEDPNCGCCSVDSSRPDWSSRRSSWSCRRCNPSRRPTTQIPDSWSRSPQVPTESASTRRNRTNSRRCSLRCPDSRSIASKSTAVTSNTSSRPDPTSTRRRAGRVAAHRAKRCPSPWSVSTTTPHRTTAHGRESDSQAKRNGRSQRGGRRQRSTPGVTKRARSRYRVPARGSDQWPRTCRTSASPTRSVAYGSGSAPHRSASSPAKPCCEAGRIAIPSTRRSGSSPRPRTHRRDARRAFGAQPTASRRSGELRSTVVVRVRRARGASPW